MDACASSRVLMCMRDSVPFHRNGLMHAHQCMYEIDAPAPGTPTQVVSGAGALRVPLLAQRAPASLTLPAVIEFGPMLVGSTARMRRTFGNTGGGGLYSVELAADERCLVQSLGSCM